MKIKTLVKFTATWLVLCVVVYLFLALMPVAYQLDSSYFNPAKWWGGARILLVIVFATIAIITLVMKGFKTEAKPELHALERIYHLSRRIEYIEDTLLPTMNKRINELKAKANSEDG